MGAQMYSGCPALSRRTNNGNPRRLIDSCPNIIGIEILKIAPIIEPIAILLNNTKKPLQSFAIRYVMSITIRIVLKINAVGNLA